MDYDLIKKCLKEAFKDLWIIVKGNLRITNDFLCDEYCKNLIKLIIIHFF